jgi:hypothetical protein
MHWLALGLIAFYQKWISPLLPSACRYYPSCSEYAKQSLQKYGFIKGSWLAAKRIARCHPRSAGGHDPVP